MSRPSRTRLGASARRSTHVTAARSGRVGGGQVRIIGGRLRGRRLSVIDRPGLRPTGDRVRETLFNWLQSHVVGAHCVDLFAGSGALGIEAASRGAASVWLVESDAAVCQQLHASLEQLSLSADAGIQVVHTTAGQWLDAASAKTPAGGYTEADGADMEAHSCDSRPTIVFVDPPFDQAVQLDVLAQLANGVLADRALVYVESPVDTSGWSSLPSGFDLHREARFGEVTARLLSFERSTGDHREV